jgi:chorismate mutase
VLSRRINYGRYVAEVKFRGDQQTYTSLIQAKVFKTPNVHRASGVQLEIGKFKL